jgi:hypothetical protein
LLTTSASRDTITIIKDTDVESAAAAKIAHWYHEDAIKLGSNFASVNIYYNDSDKSKSSSSWGGNHLELSARGRTTKEVATDIYKWLCKSDSTSLPSDQGALQPLTLP